MAINIKGVDKAEILVALVTAARPGSLHRGYGSAPIEREEAKRVLKEDEHPKWVNGRAIFVDLSGDEIDTAIYDQHNGRLCAGEALAPLITAAAARSRNPESDRDFVARVMAHSPIAAGPGRSK